MQSRRITLLDFVAAHSIVTSLVVILGSIAVRGESQGPVYRYSRQVGRPLQDDAVRFRISPSISSSTEHLQDLASNAAMLCGVPKVVAFGLVEIESKWEQSARGKHGEIGLGQIKPSTAAEISKGLDIYTPWGNLVASFCYLSKLKTTTWKDALEKYNAGPRGERTEAVKDYSQRILGESNE